MGDVAVVEPECAAILSAVTAAGGDIARDEASFAAEWELLSDRMKESALVLDLVNVLSGLGSRFFSWAPNGLTGGQDVLANELLTRDFGPDFLEMCAEILEIRRHQTEILDFVAEARLSFICQALSEELVDVLEDLQQCVSRFHDRHVQSFLGLAKLHSYLKPASQTLALLASVVTGLDQDALFYDGSNRGVLVLDRLEQLASKELGLRRELLQHLMLVCLEAYSPLICSYLSHQSVIEGVDDFFIKSSRSCGGLDEYLKRKRGGHGPEEQTDSGPASGPESVCSCNEFGLWVDARYVPNVLRGVALKVFEAGIFLRTLGAVSEVEVRCGSVEEMLSDLENVHRQASALLFDRLMGESQVLGTLAEMFNLYLMQRSDYVGRVLECLDRSLALCSAYAGAADQAEAQGCDDTAGFGGSLLCCGSPRVFFCLDNVKSLATQSTLFRSRGGTLAPLDSALVLCSDGFERLDLGGSLLSNYRTSDGFLALRLTRLLGSLLLPEPGQPEGEPDPLDCGGPDYRNLLLCYCLDAPAGLLVTPELQHAYSLMFKLLFQLRYAARRLEALWLYHARTRQLPVEPSLVHKLNLQLFLLARMQAFVRRVQHHLLVDVSAPLLSEFLRAHHADFHALYGAHWRLVDSLAHAFLLREPALLAALQRALLLAVRFAGEVLAFLEGPTFMLDALDLLGCSSEPLARFARDCVAAGDSLSALLRNPGYSGMVAVAAAEFDRIVAQFTQRLERAGHSLAEKLSGSF